MGRKIAVISGKGGVGKTTVTFGLGLSLAKMGQSVCLVDIDVGLNNLDMLFDVEDKIIFDLNDCLEGRCRIKQALVCCDWQENLYILSSSKSDVFTDISEIKFNMLIDKLASVFDYVLIDCPAGINRNFYLGLKTASEAVLVATPHISSIRDACKVICIIEGQQKQFDGVVINRVRGDLLVRGESLSFKQIENLLKCEIVGILPESEEINIYCGSFQNKKGKSEINIAFNMLAENIKCGGKRLYDCQKKYKGFLGFIRRNIKRSV